MIIKALIEENYIRIKFTDVIRNVKLVINVKIKQLREGVGDTLNKIIST